MKTHLLKRRLHHYFWTISFLALALNVMEGASLNSVLSVFMKPMTEEFGWSRGTISGVATVGALASGLLGLAIGPIMDRHGVRLMTVLGVLVLGGSLAGLGLVGDVWSFYAVNSLARISSLGIISVALTVVLSNWFVRLRGRAMGLNYMGSRTIGALLPLLALYLVTSQGWRMAWLTLGLMVLTLAIPVFFYFHHRPEDVGLRPDGASPAGETSMETSGAGPRGLEGEHVWTLRSAAKTPALWLLAVATSQGYLFMGALNMHQVPFMTDVGISPGQAVGTLTTSALAAGAGGFLFGALAERVHVRYALAAASGVGAFSIVLLLSVHSIAMAYASAVVIGLSMGSDGGSVLEEIVESGIGSAMLVGYEVPD